MPGRGPDPLPAAQGPPVPSRARRLPVDPGEKGFDRQPSRMAGRVDLRERTMQATLHDRYGISRTALAARIQGWLG